MKKMVLESVETSVYYRERPSIKRCSRFCLKPVKTIQQKDQKKSESVNVQLVKGKSSTIVNLDEEEAKKVHQHGDYVIKKLHKIHRSMIWNFYIGRSFVDKIEMIKQGLEETDIDSEERSEFRADNPKTWSEDSLDHIENILKANEFTHDGVVAMFCVRNDESEVNVDFDEVAWELEKCLIYYYIRQSSQIIMNEEARMSRQGLQPQSRKCKTPGRKRAGYVVYLAYQLLDSLTYQQIVGESINDSLDVVVKKKQLTQRLNQVKMLPQIDERMRKSVKEIREFMTSDQIKLINQIKEINDSGQVELISQFLNLLQMGNHCESRLLGLPQFISFLNNHQQENTLQRCSSRMSVASTRPGIVRSQSITSPSQSPRRLSTLPRPRTATARKSSLVSLSSSYSMAQEMRGLSDSQESSTGSVSVKLGHKKSNLASIQSSGSDIPTHEIIRLEESTQKTNPSIVKNSAKGSGSSRKSTNENGDSRKVANRSGNSRKPANGSGGSRKSVNGNGGDRKLANGSAGSGLPKRTNSFKDSGDQSVIASIHIKRPKSTSARSSKLIQDNPQILSSSSSPNQSPKTTQRKNMANDSKNLRNNSKNLGDNSKDIGNNSKNLRDDSKRLGNNSKNMENYSKILRDNSKYLGNKSKTEENNIKNKMTPKVSTFSRTAIPS